MSPEVLKSTLTVRSKKGSSREWHLVGANGGKCGPGAVPSAPGCHRNPQRGQRLGGPGSPGPAPHCTPEELWSLLCSLWHMFVCGSPGQRHTSSSCPFAAVTVLCQVPLALTPPDSCKTRSSHHPAVRSVCCCSCCWFVPRPQSPGSHHLLSPDPRVGRAASAAFLPTAHISRLPLHQSSLAGSSSGSLGHAQLPSCHHPTSALAWRGSWGLHSSICIPILP